MVLTALLIVALGCVLVGVLLASVPWLIASLVASVLAGIALYRSWGTLSERAARVRGKKASGAGPPASTASGAAAGGAAAHTAGGRGDEVWVVDGRPAFHRPGCEELLGLPE